jgi:hypothetical protein
MSDGSEGVSFFSHPKNVTTAIDRRGGMLSAWNISPYVSNYNRRENHVSVDLPHSISKL